METRPECAFVRAGEHRRRSTDRDGSDSEDSFTGTGSFSGSINGSLTSMASGSVTGEHSRRPHLIAEHAELLLECCRAKKPAVDGMGGNGEMRDDNRLNEIPHTCSIRCAHSTQDPDSIVP